MVRLWKVLNAMQSLKFVYLWEVIGDLWVNFNKKAKVIIQKPGDKWKPSLGR